MASLCGAAHEPQLIAAAQTSAEAAKDVAAGKLADKPTLAASDALAKKAPKILATLLASHSNDSRVSHGW